MAFHTGATRCSNSPASRPETKCGPISSFHDRACEVFALIKGTNVHYGLEHSAVAGHALGLPSLDWR